MVTTERRLDLNTIVAPVALVALVIAWFAHPGTIGLVVVALFLGAAVMISTNGIMELSLLIASRRPHVAVFNPEGTGAALATVGTLAALCLVFPDHLPQRPGVLLLPAGVRGGRLTGALRAVRGHPDRAAPELLPARHRHRDPLHEEHADPPSDRQTLTSLALLVVSLVSVVGLAKVESKAIEQVVADLGFPQSFVGVVIALLVLLPETIAVASIWLSGPLELGLAPVQIVLLALTVVVAVLTVIPGRATRLQGGVHLVLLAAFVFLSIQP